MHLLVIFFTLFCSVFPSFAQEEGKVNLNIMEVMADAKFRKINYRALINFKSPLTSQNVEAYLFDKNEMSLIKLDTFRLNRLQKLELDFQYLNKKDLHLVFLLEGVGFNFNDIRPAQFVCFKELTNEYTAEVINCDFGTTISYMLGYDGQGENILNTNSISKWISILDPDIYDNQTYQNYVGMFAISMSYLTRYPKHISLEMMNTGFIKVYSEVVQEYMLRISTRYYADIDSFEKTLSRLSTGFSGFGYKVEKDKSILFKTALSGLDLAERHQIFLSDFFNGSKELGFINKTVFRIAAAKFDKSTRKLAWILWPWMNQAVIEIDGKKEDVVVDEEFIVPLDFKRLTITPFGTRGKFVESVFTPESLEGISF